MSNNNKPINYVKSFKEYLYASKWVVLFFLLIFLFLEFRPIMETYDYYNDRFFSGDKIKKDELREEALSLSKQIIDFVEERERYSPDVDFENFDESVDRRRDYSRETESLFLKNYYPQVEKVRKEFLKYGITNEDLDWFLQYPSSTLMMDLIAMALASMTADL